MANRADRPSIVELAMPRHDIADYLGLTFETVSRMLAELKAISVIKINGARSIELLDRNQLAEIAS
jgi:CRP/FNR family transcriptional regulator, nitrogen fixation regulation protein